jgi:hypothetical protein
MVRVLEEAALGSASCLRQLCFCLLALLLDMPFANCCLAIAVPFIEGDTLKDTQNFRGTVDAEAQAASPRFPSVVGVRSRWPARALQFFRSRLVAKKDS